ncbi:MULTISPECIES: hypothetical protein [unclassified Kribbella]
MTTPSIESPAATIYLCSKRASRQRGGSGVPDLVEEVKRVNANVLS